VCKAILQYVGPGRKGAEIRKHFDAPPYGWPKEGIDAATAALAASDHLIARQANEPITVKRLDRSKFGAIEFRAQTVVLTMADKLAVRKMLQDAGIKCIKDQEAADVPFYVEHLRAQARAAGGPAPLSEPPSPGYLHKLESLSGNECVLAVLDHKAEIARDTAVWAEKARRRAERLPRWEQLETLLRFAGDLPVAGGIRSRADAVRESRSMLDETDPIPPLVLELADALRTELTARFDACKAAMEGALSDLKTSPDWLRLDQDLRRGVIQTAGLVPPEKPNVSSTETILAALSARNLEAWAYMKDAVAGQLDRARAEITRLLEPEAVPVSLPRATLKSATDVEAYLSELKQLLLDSIQQGPVVLK
jgi:hypothetical protein